MWQFPNIGKQHQEQISNSPAHHIHSQTIMFGVLKKSSPTQQSPLVYQHTPIYFIPCKPLTQVNVWVLMINPLPLHTSISFSVFCSPCCLSFQQIYPLSVCVCYDTHILLVSVTVCVYVYWTYYHICLFKCDLRRLLICNIL